jgi:hypothetical protein
VSHFPVLVITATQPTDDLLTATLQPWHEFECTGTDDQYVQDVDRTEEAREHFDQREDKTETAAAVIEGWFGWEAIGPGEQPDLIGKHKYGYLRVDADGQIVQAIDRTNPNKKWDWWVVGGRWKGMLRPTAAAAVREVERTGEAATFDHLKGRPGLMGSSYSDDRMASRRSDLDFAQMKAEAAKCRRASWDETVAEAHKAGFAGDAAALDALRREFYRARKVEHAAWLAGGEPRDRRAHYLAHMPGGLLRWQDVFDHFLHPRSTRSTDADVPIEEWIAAAPALATFALVKDGQWFQRGRMGWWGCVSDEKDEGEWEREFDKLIESIPGDHWLTVVDCHI